MMNRPAGALQSGVFLEVLYPFHGKTSQHLHVTAGERVQLKDRHQNGWSVVRNGRGEIGLVPTNYMRPVNAQHAPTFQKPKTFDPSLYHAVAASESKNGSPTDELGHHDGDHTSQHNKKPEISDAEKRLLVDLGLADSGDVDDGVDADAMLSPQGSPQMQQQQRRGVVHDMPGFGPQQGSNARHADPFSMMGASNSHHNNNNTTAVAALSPNLNRSCNLSFSMGSDGSPSKSETEAHLRDTLMSVEEDALRATHMLADIKREIVIVGEDHRRMDDYVKHCEDVYEKPDEAEKGPPAVDPTYVAPAVAEYLQRALRDLESEVVALRGKYDAERRALDREEQEDADVDLPLDGQSAQQQPRVRRITSDDVGESDTSNTSSDTVASGDDDAAFDDDDDDDVLDMLDGEVEEVVEEEIVYVQAATKTIVEEVQHVVDTVEETGAPVLMDDAVVDELVDDAAVRQEIHALHRTIQAATEAYETACAMEHKMGKRVKKMAKVATMDASSPTGASVSEEDVANAQREVDAMREGAVEREQEGTALRERAVELQSKIETLTKGVNKIKKKLEAGKSENEELQKYLAAKATERDALLEKKANFEQLVAAKSKEVEALQSHRAEVQKRLDGLGAEIDAQVDVMRQKTLTIRAKCDQYAADLERLKAEMAAAESS
eukprot:PhM_4_TR16919/c0_g1_i1/m.82707